MTNRPFSKRMLASKKTVGYRSHSYRWKYHPTPWKLFIHAVTKPRESILPKFGSKRFVLGIVVLSVIIGGIVLSQGPLFHNYVNAPKSCPDYQKLPSVGCTDPFTPIWDTTCAGCNNNLPDYNVYSGNNGGTVVYRTNCVSTTPCIDMGSDSTVTSIALSNTTIGDLSVVSGKALFSALIWKTTSNTLGVNKQFGFYLTTNATVPTHDISSTAAYNPKDDPSVALVQEFHCTGSCNSASDTINSGLSFLRTVGLNKDSIIKEDHGCPSGSPYMCGSSVFNPAQTFGNLHQFFLNFTGVTNGSTCGVSTGAGCSFLDLNGGQITSSNTLPWFQFQAQQYYIGFYVMAGLGAEVYFTFDVGNGANTLQYYVNAPQTTLPPQIDTGGFFGPIVRALISIGVFIAQNIINFLAFLAGVLFPVLATVFGVLAQALVAVLNAIGNFFGLGNIGTTISNFFTAVGNFLVNGVAAIFGQITNAGSFVVNGITAFVNIAGSYWTKITSFFSALGALFTIIGTVIGDFTNLSAFSGNIALFMDWTWGMYKTYDEGTEGFHRWLDFNEKVFLRLGSIAYFMADHLFQAILRVKQLIVNWV